MNVALAFWGRGDSALEEGSSFEIWGIFFGGGGERGGVDLQARKGCSWVWFVEKYLDGLGSF